MGKITFDLFDGLDMGGVVQKTITLRELTSGDILDATEEAEKIVVNKTGTVVVQSPTLVGAHLMRRQIAAIGDMQGPLTMGQLRMLSARDFHLVNEMIDQVDATAAEVTSRGRGAAPQESAGAGPDGARTAERA